jgi:hypothetical protein
MNETRDSHYILISIEEATLNQNLFLEIEIRPENYPGFGVSRIEIEDKEDFIKNVIRKNFEGWHIRKWNLTKEAPQENNEILGLD